MLLQMYCGAYNLWYSVIILIRRQDKNKSDLQLLAKSIVLCHAITMYVNLVLILSLFQCESGRSGPG